MPSFTKIMATMALALLPLTAGAPIPSSLALSSPFNADGLVRRADAIVEPTYEGEQDFKDSFDDLEVEGDYELITEETDESALEKRGKRRWSGTATWFHVGQGNCGWWNKDSDLIVALPTKQYAGGRHCGRWVQLCSGGKCVNAQVADSCPSCAYGSLDVSPRAFKALAPLSKGVTGISWTYTS